MTLPVLNYKFACYRAQIWHGDYLISEIAGLSLPAAREIARSALLTGDTGRVMSLSAGIDYCEVYAPDGVRTGTFAETTRVSGAR